MPLVYRSLDWRLTQVVLVNRSTGTYSQGAAAHQANEFLSSKFNPEEVVAGDAAVRASRTLPGDGGLLSSDMLTDTNPLALDAKTTRDVVARLVPRNSAARREIDSWGTHQPW